MDTQLSLLDSIDRTPPRKPSGEELRDIAIAKHRSKTAVQEYKEIVLPIAMRIWRERGFVTVDDLRAAVPPSEQVAGRAMGAVLSLHDGWVATGQTKSKRGVNHAKNIARFEYLPELARNILAASERQRREKMAAKKARAA